MMPGETKPTHLDRLQGTVVVAGEAEGVLLASSEPLSFWGGYDQKTGEIIDRRHPLSRRNGRHAILAIPFTRGSSTTTAILLESVRAGVAPAALITNSVDPFLALASVVADELYRAPIPVLTLSGSDFDVLLRWFGDGSNLVSVHLTNDGAVTAHPAP